MKTFWTSVVIIIGVSFVSRFNYPVEFKENIEPLKDKDLLHDEVEMYKMRVERMSSEIEVLQSEIELNLSNK